MEINEGAQFTLGVNGGGFNRNRQSDGRMPSCEILVVFRVVWLLDTRLLVVLDTTGTLQLPVQTHQLLILVLSLLIRVVILEIRMKTSRLQKVDC